MRQRVGKMAKRPTLLAVAALLGSIATPSMAADSIAGTYQGFLAFDFKGEEVREWMMVTFSGDGTVVMGAEEGHDEPVDPATGAVTKYDFESAKLGLWRAVGDDVLEFGSQQ